MSGTNVSLSAGQKALRWALWWIVLAVWTWMLLSPEAPHAVAAVVSHDLHFWVSKSGHVAGYTVLAVLAGCLPVRFGFRVGWWLFLVGHAGLTEWIQLYVPGRGGSIRDVGLDVLGITLGLLLLLAWRRFRRNWSSGPPLSATAKSTGLPPHTPANSFRNAPGQ